MNITSPIFDRNKTPANTNDVETGRNATVNSINNPNHEQSETLRNEINKYQTQIDQLNATNEQERKVDKVRYYNLEKSHKEQLQKQFLGQQRLKTIIQQLETQLNAKQETNQPIPQTSMQPSIPQIPVDKVNHHLILTKHN